MNNFIVNLPNKKIECKPYTLREHLAILLAQSNYDSELLKKAFNNILENNTNGKKLLKHEAELVLIHLMYKSNNQHFIEKEYVCECGETFPVKLNIDNTYIDGLDNDLKIKFDKFSLNLKWPLLWEDDNTPLMIASSIESINIGNEQISFDELNDKEIQHLNNCIDEDMMKKISKMLTSPKPILATPIKCPKCGKSHIEKVESFKQFLELL